MYATQNEESTETKECLGPSDFNVGLKIQVVDNMGDLSLREVEWTLQDKEGKLDSIFML